MKIIVTGSLGNISKPLAEELVKKGHAVTIISSNPGRQKDIEALGAIAAIGSIEDTDFLTATFTGADSVYSMIPPNNYFNHDLDLMAYYRSIGHNYAQAIQESGVKRVVHLSSIGAELDKGTGNILCHRAVERILNNLSNVAITFMRPASFYNNLYGFLHMIKTQGTIAANYGEDDKCPWVSPLDIAAAVAEEITGAFEDRKIRYVASEELTCNEIASTVGAAIGKSDLKWIIISNEQTQSGLEAAGMNPQIAAGFVEMNASIHNGKFLEDYHRNRPTLGKVKLTDFAKEFASVFNSK